MPLLRTDAVLDSMKNHMKNSIVQERACDVLHELTNHGKSILDYELQTEAIRILLLLVDTLRDNGELLPRIINNLNHLSHTEKNAVQLASGGGVARIVSILKEQDDFISRATT